MHTLTVTYNMKYDSSQLFSPLGAKAPKLGPFEYFGIFSIFLATSLRT